MKKRKNPCKGCIWAERISEGIIFCPFPKCVKGKLPTGHGRKERDKLGGEPGKTGVGR